MKTNCILFFLIFSSKNLFAQEIGTKKNFILNSKILKDGTKRLEIDLNQDKKADRIEIYRNDILISLERDSDYSEKMDEWVTYSPYVSPEIPIEILKKSSSDNGKIDRIQKFYRNPEYDLLITTTEVDSKHNGQFDKKWTASTKLSQKRDKDQCIGNVNLDTLKILKLANNISPINQKLSNGFYANGLGFKFQQSCLDKWGANSFPKILSSTMSKGFQCLADLAKKNKSTKSSPNGAANNLLAFDYLLKSKGISIVCNQEEYNWSGISGHASLTPTEEINKLEVKHPFISINPNDPVVKSKPTETEILELSKTLFHEQFHNLGYGHFNSIEYPYTCETCCISNSKPDEKNSACKICAGAYKNETDKKYLLDIVAWGKISYNLTSSSKAVINFEKEFPSDRFGLFAYADASSDVFEIVGVELGKILKEKFSPLSKEEQQFIKNTELYDNSSNIDNMKENAKMIANLHISLYYEQDSKKVLKMLDDYKIEMQKILILSKEAPGNYKYIYQDLQSKIKDILKDIWLKDYPNGIDSPESIHAYSILSSTGYI